MCVRVCVCVCERERESVLVNAFLCAFNIKEVKRVAKRGEKRSFEDVLESSWKKKMPTS